MEGQAIVQPVVEVKQLNAGDIVNGNGRLHGLDFVKVIATILIVLHHYWQVHNVYIDNGINFFNGKFYFGYLVELFFVLSGFFMLSDVEKIKHGTGFRKFFIKKYMRFQPLMLITVITFSGLAAAFEGLYQAPWSGTTIYLWGIISSAIGIQGGWALPNPCINNPIWYISVLLLCEIILYVFVGISKKHQIPLEVFYTVMIFLGMGIMEYNINLPFMNVMTCRGFYAFFWGLMLASILSKRQPSRIVAIISGVIVVGLPFLIAFTASSFTEEGSNYLMTFIYFTAVVLVFTTKGVNWLFSSRLWEVFAEIAYNTYMWHSCVFIMVAIFFFVMNIVPDFTDIGTIVGMASVSCVVGAISYFCIEKPMRKMVGKMVAKETGTISDNSDSVG